MPLIRIPSRESRRQVLGLAVPIVLASLSQTLMTLIDIAMVGRIGVAAVAAVGLGGMVTYAIIALLSAIQPGVQTLVARRWGEDKPADVEHIFRVAFSFALIVGNLMAVLFIRIVPQSFGLLNHDPEVVAIGTAYLQYRGWSLGIVMAGAVFYGFYNGIGKTRIHLTVTLAANIINVILNYGFIFGRLGLPDMGAPGAGLATTIASLVTTALYGIMTLAPAIRQQYSRLWNGAISLVVLKQILRLSLPAGLHQLGTILGFTVFMVMMGWVSTVAMASFEILINIISFSFLPATGFMYACQTLVSRSLGERNLEKARQFTAASAVLCILFMGSLGILFILFPGQIIRLFTPDSAIIESATMPLRIIGLVQFFDAVGMVHLGALRGAGDVLFPAVAELLVMWLLFLPLTYFAGIALGWGLLGGWLALAFHIAVYSVIFLLRFRYGPWQRITL